MNRVPFTLPDVGLSEVRGMVWIDEGFLVLQIQKVLLGMLDEEKEIVKIEPAALREFRIKRGLLRDRLVLRPKKPELLDLVPGEHPVALELRVWRKYRPELMRLVDVYEALC